MEEDDQLGGVSQISTWTNSCALVAILSSPRCLIFTKIIYFCLRVLCSNKPISIRRTVMPITKLTYNTIRSSPSWGDFQSATNHSTITQQHAHARSGFAFALQRHRTVSRNLPAYVGPLFDDMIVTCCFISLVLIS